MGLFGYGKGDYDKNTAIFKNRLNGLMMDLSRFGSGEYGLSGVLTELMMTLERTSYPKGKSKDQEAIDARISKLIDSLQTDLQKKNAASFSEHASMLADAVGDSRKFAKERYTPDELLAQEGMANCKGQIGDAITQKAAIEEKKQALLSKAKKLIAEGKQAEAQRLNIEYNACIQNEKVVDKRITAFSAQYNAFLKVSGARENGKLADELDANKLINGSLADFDKELRQNNMKLEKSLTRITDVESIVDTYETDVTDAFSGLNTGANIFDLAEKALANDMAKTVQDTPVNVSEESIEDDFMKALNNYK